MSAQGFDVAMIGGGLPGVADLDRQRSTVDFFTLAKGARAATKQEAA